MDFELGESVVCCIYGQTVLGTYIGRPDEYSSECVICLDQDNVHLGWNIEHLDKSRYALLKNKAQCFGLSSQCLWVYLSDLRRFV